MMIDAVPESALAWAARAVGPHATIERVRPLAGGTHAMTHLLRTVDPRLDVVLRRFPAGDTAARDEAVVLTALDGLDGLAPRLIDVDPTGERAGLPATLITRVAGEPDIMPADPHRAAAELARVLARVHATPLAALGRLRSGLGSGDPRLTGQPSVLTHYDYWTGNVLWQGDTISGVIDWAGGARAPRGHDVSWCRLDLVLLHDHATAETFLTAYEHAAGEPVPDIHLWDLFAVSNSQDTVETWLPNYHSLGRTDLTTADLRDRHTRWTRAQLGP